MSLRKTYHHLSEEKRAAIMTLAREGFSGAHIARHCGVSEAAVSREFSRQFPKSIPLKERRQRYEASAACARYREKRKQLRNLSASDIHQNRCAYRPQRPGIHCQYLPLAVRWIPAVRRSVTAQA